MLTTSKSLQSVTKLVVALVLSLLMPMSAHSADSETHTVKAQGLKFMPLVVTIDNGDTDSLRNMPKHKKKSL